MLVVVPKRVCFCRNIEGDGVHLVQDGIRIALAADTHSRLSEQLLPESRWIASDGPKLFHRRLSIGLVKLTTLWRAAGIKKGVLLVYEKTRIDGSEHGVPLSFILDPKYPLNPPLHHFQLSEQTSSYASPLHAAASTFALRPQPSDFCAMLAIHLPHIIL